MLRSLQPKSAGAWMCDPPRAKISSCWATPNEALSGQNWGTAKNRIEYYAHPYRSKYQAREIIPGRQIHLILPNIKQEVSPYRPKPFVATENEGSTYPPRSISGPIYWLDGRYERNRGSVGIDKAEIILL